MDEKKQEDTAGVAVESTPELAVAEDTMIEANTEAEAAMETPAMSEAPVVGEMAAEVSSPAPKSFNIRAYVGMVLVILIICTGLLFILEKEGRTNTGLFAGVIAKMDASKAVALVDGVKIYKSEYDSSVRQLTNMTAEQGADVTDPTVVEQLKNQAMDTLVNAEILRQAAVREGVTVTPEQIDARYTEIQDGIGGEEALMKRMAEFNVTKEGLRRDISNEFLIQGLFDIKVDTSSITVDADEIKALYDQAGGSDAGLPPLDDVKDQIEAQIKFDKEQKLISAYIDTLKSDVKVEILI